MGLGSPALVLQLRIEPSSSMIVGRDALVGSSPLGPGPYEDRVVLSDEYELCEEPTDFGCC